VRIAHEHGVVSPDERAVKGAADARVGLRTDNDESPDAEAGKYLLEAGLSLEPRLRVLNPDDRAGFLPGPVQEATKIRDDG
jgi:hypothetical protein